MIIGDCVQLKTGGCLMTVGAVIPSNAFTLVECVWFNDEGELKSEHFDERALRQWMLVSTQPNPSVALDGG